MNHDSQTSFPPKAVARNVGDLAHDIMELGELQTALLKVDVGQWSRQLTVPLIVLVGAAVLWLGTVPVLLSALAYVLVEFAEWSLALSYLVASLLGLAVGGVGAAFGWLKLRSSVSVFRRSQEEFSHNVRWLKQVLKHGGEVGYRRSA